MISLPIPLYRAKKIDSDEWVEGYLVEDENNDFWITENIAYCYQGLDYYNGHKIYPKTLAIHFPSMIDKNGQKIFASLSEDGVGGDIVDMGYNYIKATMILNKTLFVYSFIDSEIIGIHKC